MNKKKAIHHAIDCGLTAQSYIATAEMAYDYGYLAGLRAAAKIGIKQSGILTLDRCGKAYYLSPQSDAILERAEKFKREMRSKP